MVAMIGLLVPAFLAVLLALVLYGAPANWSHFKVRWRPVAILALLVQVALFTPPVDEQPWAIAWGPWIWVISMVVLLAVISRNGVAGNNNVPWRVAGLGLALNLVVVVANGGYMPLSAEALVATKGEDHLAEHSSIQSTQSQFTNVVLLGPQTRIAWLGDVLPEPAWVPGGANVVSVGDLLLSAGLAYLAFSVTAAGRRPPRWSWPALGRA